MSEKKIEKSLGRVLFSILVLSSSFVFAHSQDTMADSDNKVVNWSAISQNGNTVDTVDIVDTSAISPLIITPCATTVNWHNLNNPTCDSSNEGVTMSIVDQNLDIIGTNVLVNPIDIVAQTCDILITVTNGDVVITRTGIWNCGGDSTTRSNSNPRTSLDVVAEAGRTVLFQLNNNLVFTGTSDNSGVPMDFVITFTGAGTIAFELDGGTMSFEEPPNNGGVIVFGNVQQLQWR